MAPPAMRKAQQWAAGKQHSGPTRAARDAELEIDGLYRGEAEKLTKSAERHLRTREEARDIVQDAFVRLLRIRKSGNAVERSGAYLNRIVRNILVDRAAVRRREAAYMQEALEQDTPCAFDPHSLLESRDHLNRLEAAILRLKPRTRAIFLAHRIDGLSYAEIAERTGLSMKGVEKQMGKALAQLDRMLGRG